MDRLWVTGSSLSPGAQSLTGGQDRPAFLQQWDLVAVIIAQPSRTAWVSLRGRGIQGGLPTGSEPLSCTPKDESQSMLSRKGVAGGIRPGRVGAKELSGGLMTSSEDLKCHPRLRVYL